MSGNFGWSGGGGGGGSDDSGGGSSRDPYGSAYSRYSRPTQTPSPASNDPYRSPGQSQSQTPGSVYQKPATPPRAPDPAPSAVLPPTVPDALHDLRTTARNVIVIAMDTTGSMEQVPKEFYERFPLLHQEASKHLGSNDLEILVLGFGDAMWNGKSAHPLQVTRFGRGPELDGYLQSIDMEGGGGGNDGESAELALYYLLMKVDWSASKRVYVFVVTNEPGHDDLRSDYGEHRVRQTLGIGIDPSLATAADIIREANQRFKLYVILGDYTRGNCTLIGKDRIGNELYHKAWWTRHIGSEDRILPLPLAHARRGTDTILGAIALDCGKLAEFEADFAGRQQGNSPQHVAENTSVLSVALAGPMNLSMLLPGKKMATGPGSEYLAPSTIFNPKTHNKKQP